MKKKIKLNVTDLKVQSFVTEVPEYSANELRGGSTGGVTIGGPGICWHTNIYECAVRPVSNAVAICPL